MGPQLGQLHRYHAELEELLLCHQEALLLADWGLARRYLALYGSGLRLHIRQEDELLLPRYREHEQGQPWPARVYEGEHRKLERQLQLCRRAFAALLQAPSRRGVIGLIEQQKSLKHLAEHHHQREEESLFPVLDAALGEAQKSALLATMARQWQARPAASPRLRARLAARLQQATWSRD